jgi:hypothetical protein
VKLVTGSGSFTAHMSTTYVLSLYGSYYSAGYNIISYHIYVNGSPIFSGSTNADGVQNYSGETYAYGVWNINRGQYVSFDGANGMNWTYLYKPS